MNTKEIVKFFRDHDKGFALGPFTDVRTTDVDEWVKTGALQMRRSISGALAMIVIQRYKSASNVVDFTAQTVARTSPADIMIKRIAYHAGAEQQVIAMIQDLERLNPRARIWIEIFAEHPGDRAIVEVLGFTWVCSKVKATAEIMMVFSKPSYCPPIRSVDKLGLAKLPLKNIETDKLLAAVTERISSWANHYSIYNKKDSWSALSLRGYHDDVSVIYKPTEMSKKWKAENPDKLGWRLRDTELRTQLPEAEALIEMIPGRKHRIRLMHLSAGGGELERHTDNQDPDVGTVPGKELRIHFPLVTNPGVEFGMWLLDGAHQKARMAVGECWYLDTRKPHTAVNRGTAGRIHLVIDVEVSRELLNLLEQAEQAPTI